MGLIDLTEIIGLIGNVTLIEVHRLIDLFEMHDSAWVTNELLVIIRYMEFVERINLLQSIRLILEAVSLKWLSKSPEWTELNELIESMYLVYVVMESLELLEFMNLIWFFIELIEFV